MFPTFIASMFLLGLGTSLHCVSMCGPLVLTYAVKGEQDGPWYRRLTPNVAYQGAKVVSYMLVGLLLGAVGSFLNLDALRPYVMYAAGVFMIVQIVLEQREALTIPEQAVVLQGRSAIAYRIKGTTAERVELQLGQRSFGRVEVLSGLDLGDLVATTGLQRLRDGALVEIQDQPPQPVVG